MDETLSTLDRDDLETIIRHLVARDPALTDILAAEIASLPSAAARAASTPEAPHPPEPFDEESIRPPLQGDLRLVSRAWWAGVREYSAIQGAAGREIDQVYAYLDAGDIDNALMTLDTLTQEYVEEWAPPRYDWYDETGDEWFELGAVWTETLLAPDLKAEDRESWADDLIGRADQLSDYGMDEAFEVAREAAQSGWDDPALQRVLRGEVETEEIESLRDSLDAVPARLNVLARYGRIEEYLRLARAAQETLRYTQALVLLGRVDEAVAYGLEHLTSSTEALTVAKTLHEQGNPAAALQIGEHGLEFEDSGKVQLAAWVRDLAAEMGETERALRAAVITVRAAPTLDAYKRAQELAGEAWEAPAGSHRDELIDYIRQYRGYNQHGQVDILLDEGLIDDAVAAMESSHDGMLIGRVADAAIETHPDWVIAQARKQSEPIMKEKEAQRYDYAAGWVRRARDAYRAAGREAEWQEHIRNLIATYQSLRKLRPMLEALK